MRYGMPTLVECKDIEECALVAKRCGLDFIEVNMSFPQYNPKNSDVNLYRRLSEKYNLFYTIHADEQLNPFDFNSDVSDCYFSVMAECIDFAKAIGAPVINLHLLKGVYVTLPGKVILLTDVYKGIENGRFVMQNGRGEKIELVGEFTERQREILDCHTRHLAY